MTASSRQKSSRKQSKHSSKEAADYSDSEMETEIIEEKEWRTKNYGEESSVRVSCAGEKRRLGDRGGSWSRHGTGSEDVADVERISSKKRRRESEKMMKEKISDTERQSKEEVRNLELKKELEKQIRRSRDGSVENKYQDYVRDEKDSRRSSRGEHDKARYKDGASYKVKYGEDADRDSRHRDSKFREDFDWKKRHREDRHKDEYALRDHHSDRPGSKYTRDESYAAERRYKKSRYDDGEYTRYNDDRGNRADDKVDQNYSRSRSTKERHFKSENDGEHTNYDDDDRGNRVHDREDQNYSRSRSTKEQDFDSENDGEHAKYDDDRGNRVHDSEDQNYSKTRSTKERHFDPEKKVTVSIMAEAVADKEGSRLRRADADLNASCNRERNSPNSYSHLSKDQSRPSIQAELKYGDSESEERVRQNLLPSKVVADVSGVLEQPCLSKPTEWLIDKDDSNLGDLTGDRGLINESKPSTSPVHLLDDSKLTRFTGENYDSKEFGKRSGVKDTESSGTEGKGSWQLPSKTLPTGERSQEDADVFSSIKADQVPSNSWSNLPRPRRRANCPNAGRVRGNARNGVPNWPSPLVNNFTHFQHGPVAVGFHPLPHQFSAFPMYGVRPVMDINHPVFSHHVPDVDRYFSHGQQCRWQNPVGSHPPLHGRDADNVATRPEALAYGMLDWNHNTESVGGQQLETTADLWKSSNGGVHAELPSVSEEEDPAVHAKEDETWLGVSRLQENPSDALVDKGLMVEIGLASDDLAKEPSKASKRISETLPKLSNIPKDDDGRLWLVYLSRLDISAELTHPEIYNKCLTLKGVEQSESIDEDSLELLCLEEVVKTHVELPKLASSASLFVAIDDSVFQRAMSFYKKQREETRAIPLSSLSDGEQTSFCSAQKLDIVPICENEVVPFSSSNEVKQGLFFPACCAPHKKVDELIPVLNLEKSCKPSPRQGDTSMILDQETINGYIEDKSPTLQLASQSAPCRSAYLSRACDSIAKHSVGSAEEKKSLDTRSDGITFLKVSGEAFEGVMSQSIEPGSVTLSRIHDSLEITH